jgi:ribosomal protein L21E
MKFSALSIGLCSLTTLATLVSLPISRASAQCVMNDTNIQVTISGSRQPTRRTNDVTQGSTGNCVGNSTSSTNVQTNIGGTERATQNRRSSQQITGGDGNPTGVNVPPVKLRQNVQIDVYNAADKLHN